MYKKRIFINGKMNAPLDWEAAKEEARRCVSEGLSIFWHIDLGLFSQLPFPLSNQTQYRSLGFALEHFKKTLFPEFHETTSGICLYSGPLNFSGGFIWDEEQENNLQDWLKEALIDHSHLINSEKGERIMRQFYSDVAIDYLQGLHSFLPAALHTFITLDASTIKSPLECAELLVKERYGHIQVMVENSPLPKSEEAKIGICLPTGIYLRQYANNDLEFAMNELLQKKVPFRIMTEHSLTSQWDGLDEIWIVSKTLTPQGMRKLQGFRAASGKVVTI